MNLYYLRVFQLPTEGDLEERLYSEQLLELPYKHTGDHQRATIEEALKKVIPGITKVELTLL